MDPTLFPNVNPAPLLFAPVPAAIPSIVGMRSFDPTLPAVGGYSDADLERMQFTLMRSGMDPAMLARIREVMAMRRRHDPSDAAKVEAGLLRPTPAKLNAVGWRQHNPFDVAADAMQPAQ